jgi:2-(3-amino-3-carboxypropyl)histidine synthase
MMENYDLELNKAVDEIKKKNAKLVCIQLPDGLKPKAKEIQHHIEQNTSASVVIWLGSCWGGCDIPLSVEKLGVDLLIQWGHSHYIRAW